MSDEKNDRSLLCGDLDNTTGTICRQLAPHPGTMHGKPGHWWAHPRPGFGTPSPATGEDKDND